MRKRRCARYVVAVEPQDVCMEELRRKYRDNERVTLVQKSVGDRGAEGEIVLSSAHTLASMSREWIRSVKASGRFPTTNGIKLCGLKSLL